MPVIIEKPFGTDLAPAQAPQPDGPRRLRRGTGLPHRPLLLGKESIDNVLAFRFANGLFEPIWNREHVHVQIDVPETLSIEGRAEFYEHTGAFRDMVVTHLFQVMGPSPWSCRPSLAARRCGTRRSRSRGHADLDVAKRARPVHGLSKRARRRPGSQTETFIALRTEVDNWRWAVPFFLRTGKSLGQSRQVITPGLREPTLRMFPDEAIEGRAAATATRS
jgi:glucose-6-phosphate 1-dehydrogenase